MAERYSHKVLAYCRERGVEVPVGFMRRPASRYVAIDLGSTPHKLVAASWITQADMLYYLNNLADNRPHMLLDFKEQRELVVSPADGKLEPAGEF